mgnify:CR=1 FL=1
MQDIQDDLVLDSDSQKINSQKLVFQSASMYYVDTLIKKLHKKGNDTRRQMSPSQCNQSIVHK